MGSYQRGLRDGYEIAHHVAERELAGARSKHARRALDALARYAKELRDARVKELLG